MPVCPCWQLTQRWAVPTTQSALPAMFAGRVTAILLDVPHTGLVVPSLSRVK
ncbi:hypothetical protein ACFVZD_46420 [Streptomyces sp. NPDC058287]|uniref:hypothetical protein n=1 Tax=unclassified Streptomyces TaxID=2593676 RepID=UPI0036E89322